MCTHRPSRLIEFVVMSSSIVVFVSRRRASLRAAGGKRLDRHSIPARQQPLGTWHRIERVVAQEVLRVQDPAQPFLKATDAQAAAAEVIHAGGLPYRRLDHVDLRPIVYLLLDALAVATK